MVIKQKKKTNKILENFNKAKVQIGIPVLNSENMKLNLFNVGDTVLPSMSFGPVCKKNAVGYSYVDKTAPKENRYVCTIWTYPYGNTKASQIPVDQYRMCYPKINVEASGIEIVLYEDKDGNKFLLAMLDDIQRSNYLLVAINMFIEIFGECHLFEDISNLNLMKIKRLNWEILPPGIQPSYYFSGKSKQLNKKIDRYAYQRLKYIESLNPLKPYYYGAQGFSGYIIYVFNDFCVLESAIYGNATYIIPKENWESLSQKTKKELTFANLVLYKIIHRKDWEEKIDEAISKLHCINEK